MPTNFSVISLAGIMIFLNATLASGCRSHLRTHSTISNESFPFSHSPEALAIAKKYLTDIVNPVDRPELIDPKENDFFTRINAFHQTCRLKFDTFPNDKAASRPREYVFSLDVRIYLKDQKPEDLSVLGAGSLPRVLVPKDYSYSPHRFKIDNPRYNEILRVQSVLLSIMERASKSCGQSPQSQLLK